MEADAAPPVPKARVKLTDKLRDGGVWADQGVIAGCSGGLFDNITEAADILRGGSTGNGAFTLDVYPTSVPVSMELTRLGQPPICWQLAPLSNPASAALLWRGGCSREQRPSLRHTTRNFPNREGSKPGEGQFAGCASWTLAPLPPRR